MEIGGTRIENLYDMTYALQDHKPGDTVDVVVVRGGARVVRRPHSAADAEGAVPRAGRCGRVRAAPRPYRRTARAAPHSPIR